MSAQEEKLWARETQLLQLRLLLMIARGVSPDYVKSFDSSSSNRPLEYTIDRLEDKHKRLTNT
jgi:hypothetical protein